MSDLETSLESNSTFSIDKEVFPKTRFISTLYKISLINFKSILFLSFVLY
jgi:hypothetical protein